MNSKWRIALLLVAGFWLTAGVPAGVRAQFPPGMDAFNPTALLREGQVSALNLVQTPDMQKELKIEKSQSEAFKKLQKERDAIVKGMGKGGGTDPSAIMGTMQKVRADLAELDARAKALLTDPQKTRLSEIRVQILGAQAITDPEIQSALALAPEQKSALADLDREFASARMAALTDYRNAKRKNAAIDKEFGEKAAKILTAEQSTRLAAMAGTPFKGVDRIKML